jgi:hypothetical protein
MAGFRDAILSVLSTGGTAAEEGRRMSRGAGPVGRRAGGRTDETARRGDARGRESADERIARGDRRGPTGGRRRDRNPGRNVSELAEKQRDGIEDMVDHLQELSAADAVETVE